MYIYGTMAYICRCVCVYVSHNKLLQMIPKTLNILRACLGLILVCFYIEVHNKLIYVCLALG